MTQATTQKAQELSVEEVVLVVGGAARKPAYETTYKPTDGSTDGMVGILKVRTGISRPGA